MGSFKLGCILLVEGILYNSKCRSACQLCVGGNKNFSAAIQNRKLKSYMKKILYKYPWYMIYLVRQSVGNALTLIYFL